MKRKVAYIAGPMKGYPLWNFPLFDKARDFLMGLGYTVLSPADMDRAEGFDPETSVPDKEFLDDAMERDIEAIMVADFLVMLPGWRSSVGATAEYHLAKWRHIPVYQWPEMDEVVDAGKSAEKDPKADTPSAWQGEGVYLKTATLPDGTVVGCADTPEGRVLYCGPAFSKVDPKAEAGSKKCPMQLLPPMALVHTAWVHQFGAERYGPYNWRETGVKQETYVGAIMRHLMLMHDGEWFDPESGHPHAAHIAASCNILMDADAHGKLER